MLAMAGGEARRRGKFPSGGRRRGKVQNGGAASSRGEGVELSGELRKVIYRVICVARWMGPMPAARRGDAAFLQNAGIGGLGLPRAWPWAGMRCPFGADLPPLGRSLALGQAPPQRASSTTAARIISLRRRRAHHFPGNLHDVPNWRAAHRRRSRRSRVSPWGPIRLVCFGEPRQRLLVLGASR